MLRVSILDACFPVHKNEAVGVAAMLVRHLCSKGFEICSPSKCDIIMVSCVSAMQYKYVKRIRKDFPGKFIVVGGAASTSPAAFMEFADAICIGDCQQFLNMLASDGIHAACGLKNVWTQGKESVTVDCDFPWDAPPIQREDGAYQLYAGRGCKNKCYFCQTGWAMEYSENPNPNRMLENARHLTGQGKKIAYLSNDVSQHSFCKMLLSTGHGSFSFRFIKKAGLPPARQIRLGVEGVSERLRKAVGKPILHSDLVKCTSWLNENGKSVRWFLIAGLPGETESDWEELREALLLWKRMTPKGVLGVSFTAWCPDPATPLAIQPVVDDYWINYAKFREWFFSGRGWSNRIKLMHPQQPHARMQKAMASMWLSELQLRNGGCWGPNDIVEYPYKKAAKKIAERMTCSG